MLMERALWFSIDRDAPIDYAERARYEHFLSSSPSIIRRLSITRRWLHRHHCYDVIDVTPILTSHDHRCSRRRSTMFIAYRCRPMPEMPDVDAFMI